MVKYVYFKWEWVYNISRITINKCQIKVQLKIFFFGPEISLKNTTNFQYQIHSIVKQKDILWSKMLKQSPCHEGQYV